MYDFVPELIKKRKYIPESEIETQCDDDVELFEQNSQASDFERVSEVDDTMEDGPTYTTKTKDSTMRMTKTTKNTATCTEKQTQDVAAVTVADVHGCKYFGQFVANELLRFDITERYAIMQNIIELLKKIT